MPNDLYPFKIYTGQSMNPTFRTLDRLQIIPYHGRTILPGDVIVFSHLGLNRKATHRVVSTDSQGIRTRGDNNPYDDPWILTPGQVLGRVVCAQRRNLRLRICGGLIGQLYVTAVRATHLIESKISTLLHPVYHRLARTDIFRLWLPALVKTRILSFNRPDGRELQLVIGHFVIGRRLPKQNQWQIRRPFRLLVNEASLP
jgi:hypothetical protein